MSKKGMENNIMSDDIEIVAVLDKEKLPEDIRSLIEEKFSKDIQAKLFEMLETKPNKNKYDKNQNSRDIDDNLNDNLNKLFSIQAGTVIGNIYDKNFNKKKIQ